METCFKSISREGIAYEVLAEYQYSARMDGIHSRFTEYRCFDDGIIHHSGNSQTGTDNILDFLASLSVFMIESPDLKFLDVIEGIWPREPNKELVDFFVALKFTEKKTIYYSHSLRKVSSSEKYRYDKRWEEIPTWANGTLTSVLRLLGMEFDSNLLRFYNYCHIREYLGEKINYYEYIKGYNVGLSTENEFSNLHNALGIVDGLVQAYRLQDRAKRNLSCLANNWIQYQKTPRILTRPLIAA